MIKNWLTKITAILALSLVYTNAQSSVVWYSGFIGESAIQLGIDNQHNWSIYVYDAYDTPIQLNLNKSGNALELTEHRDGKPYAILKFPSFDEANAVVNGEWVQVGQSKKFKISLIKEYEFSQGATEEWPEEYELLQFMSLDHHYFTVVLSKEKGNYNPVVNTVRVYEKKTDRLIQQIEMEGDWQSFYSVDINDYNFDGIWEFSVCESGYAGPNTSRIYFLKNSTIGKYERSDFSGVSLDFDQEKKLIYEHNQCCAGTKHIIATYKVVDNHMVLVERRCLGSNEEGELVDVPCEEE